MPASRSALIIASDTYSDPQLSALRAPGQDAQALGDVLRDPSIGNFEVKVLMNERHYEVRLALEDFFADRRPADLLLLHFSCHGVKDEAGRLFFAAADTHRNRLNATAIAAEYVNDLLNQTRSRQVVLLLDCCFSGAFTSGMIARGAQTLDVADGFHGRGRAVLTASGALEYAWEGDAITRLNEPSIFTSAVVEGLRSGDADRDRDEQVSVDDLYDYVFDAVRRKTPNQTPGKWSDVEGTLVIARNPRPGLSSQWLPAELQAAVEDERSWVRAAVVDQLARLAHGPDRQRARAAEAALQRLAQDDSRRVAGAAEAALRAPAAGGFTLPEAVAPLATPRDPELRRTVGRPWLPAAAVGSGWMLGWVISLALTWVADPPDLATGLTLLMATWCVTAVLVGGAVRWLLPGTPLQRIALPLPPAPTHPVVARPARGRRLVRGLARTGRNRLASGLLEGGQQLREQFPGSVRCRPVRGARGRRAAERAGRWCPFLCAPATAGWHCSARVTRHEQVDQTTLLV
ncbi:MAG: caspase family protein [Chloroflexi bacterium]|nr:caspase family protein [Chloroflexota bacterium]